MPRAIARHTLCLDLLRATRAARVDPDAETDAAVASEADSVEHELERAEMTACVRAQIDRLPEAQRAVILLYDILGLSHHDVAAVLGVDVGTAEVRARRKLRTLLESACSFDHDTHDVLVCEPKRPGR
jgi:RNA polymerase sigma factor (sigma-70 family)